MGFFSKIKEGLKKTRTSIGDGFNAVFSVFKKVDEDFLEELLELLIMADVGYDTSERIIGELRKKAKLESLNDPESVKNALAQIIAEAMTGENGLNISTSPSVILVVDRKTCTPSFGKRQKSHHRGSGYFPRRGDRSDLRLGGAERHGYRQTSGRSRSRGGRF